MEAREKTMMNKKTAGKRILAVLMGVFMITSMVMMPETKASAAESNMTEVSYAERTEQTQLPFRELSVDDMVAEMGTGWNLGNTMDGHTGFTPNETLWQNVETSQFLIDSVHDLGFNTVRIPVTWGTMIDDENGYAINDIWLSRVQDIVDYCISQDMYVIVNIHHDGAEQNGWLRIGSEDFDSVKEKYAAVWTQIAERFKNYDEHLILESMNEVVGPDDSNAGILQDTQRIMELNQIFVDTVRGTGSNNAVRWLSVPGRYTNIQNMTNAEVGFDIPTDTVENRIFAAVHYYDWNFGMLENMNITEWDPSFNTKLQLDFVKLYERFTSQGIPVIMGEYGCINKNNPEQRAYHVESVNRFCQMYGVVPVYWDQGWYDRSAAEADYSYTLVDRNTGETIDKVVTDALMRGMFVAGGTEDISDVVLSPEVLTISDVTLSAESAILAIGDTMKIDATLAPENTNDVLLWSSADSSVATVYNGTVRARGIGVTTLTAASQSGSVAKEVTIRVTAATSEAPCTEITTGADSYEIEKGKYVFLDPVMAPENTDAYITYASSNEAVATVSTVGKVLGLSDGITYITMTASTGLTKTVPVTVTASTEVTDLRLALNVYYNDEEHGYFSNEVGQPVKITGDGQYTATFNCETDLSDNAATAGVTGLANLTAVYLKDQDVTEGNAKKTPLTTCNITYDEITVNGVALTITQEEPKSALKASGIFDTNDPLNSWDGSQVEEVSVDNHVLNITAVDAPTTISVTFTLSDVVFSSVEPVVKETIEVEGITPAAETLTVAPGEAVDLSVTVQPADAEAAVTFVSGDASIASIASEAVTTDAATGNATATLVGMSEGTTVVTVYAENGTTAQIQVTVAGEAVDVPAAGGESTDGSGSADADASNDTAKASSGLSTTAIIVIIIGAVVVIGVIIFVIITLKPAKEFDTKKADQKKEDKK